MWHVIFLVFVHVVAFVAGQRHVFRLVQCREFLQRLGFLWAFVLVAPVTRMKSGPSGPHKVVIGLAIDAHLQVPRCRLLWVFYHQKVTWLVAALLCNLCHHRRAALWAFHLAARGSRFVFHGLATLWTLAHIDAAGLPCSFRFVGIQRSHVLFGCAFCCIAFFRLNRVLFCAFHHAPFVPLFFNKPRHIVTSQAWRFAE